MQNKPVLVFDFDSTFVTVETLEELAQLVLEKNPQKNVILQDMKQITELGMTGQIPFEESLERRLALFKPTQESIIQLTAQLENWITPSVLRNRKFFQENADNFYIITGGFREYIIPLVSKFGIAPDHVLANSFIFDAQGIFMGIDKTNPLSRQGGKAKAVQSLNLPGEIWIIGDGYTDYEVKEQGAADRFYAFVENQHREKVVQKADQVIKTLDELLTTLYS